MKWRCRVREIAPRLENGIVELLWTRSVLNKTLRLSKFMENRLPARLSEQVVRLSLRAKRLLVL
jgi:hypothetical protein